MALNPFFLQGSSGEQSLVQSLINEQLRMYGVEVYYMPREYLTENTVIKEVVQSAFTNAYPIEAYVNDYEGYGDNSTILSKFGIESTQEMSFTISKERFENYISRMMELEDNMKLTTRPKEGDLIYFPLGDRLFEIKFVEHEKPFYQLQKNYVYELRCELFRYEDEVINTGVEDIDDALIGGESDGAVGEDNSISTILGYTQTLTMIGAGATATASVGGISDGGISYVSISNRGGGYLSVPSITVSAAPDGGVTGILSVTKMIGGINVCNLNTNPSAQSVQQVDIVNSGAGYTVAPLVKASGGDGVGFAATVGIADDVISFITVTDGGGGYVSAPSVTFVDEVFLTGVTTVSAAATAILDSGGAVSEIRLTNAGAGYSVAPTITIGDPNFDSTGNFVFNELVTGSTSGTTARVRTWDSTTNILEVSSITGEFINGETIVGSTSGATHVLRTVSTDPTDPYADNFNIETEADSILDFSEQNPFGIP